MDPPTHVTEWDTPVRASVRQQRQIGHTQESIRDITGVPELEQGAKACQKRGSIQVVLLWRRVSPRSL